LWRLEDEPGSMSSEEQQAWLKGFAAITRAVTET
jgi:hypothetical protein